MSIYKKLFEAKKEIGKISKDSTNPFFKSKYFDINTLLEHVEPILQQHGLLLLQPIEAEWIKTKIFDVDSSEFVSSEMHLGEIKDPQKLGMAITYYRRYTLQSLLGLQAEDDDANSVSKTTNSKEETPVIWLTDAGLKQAIERGLDAVNQTLEWYNGSVRQNTKDGKDYKYMMKKAFKQTLKDIITDEKKT